MDREEQGTCVQPADRKAGRVRVSKPVSSVARVALMDPVRVQYPAAGPGAKPRAEMLAVVASGGHVRVFEENNGVRIEVDGSGDLLVPWARVARVERF